MDTSYFKVMENYRDGASPETAIRACKYPLFQVFPEILRRFTFAL
jgi:hypothetical protein